MDQIRHANDVVDVIGSYFPLKRAGANFRALCPFHKEKTPSFNVNPAKQIWHCFGCGAGGDVFTFVMKYENLDFPAAVRRLAERGGVRVEFEESPGGPTRDEKDALLKLHEDVAGWFHANLMKEKAADAARAYLKKREITAETAKRWRLGYSPDAWDALLTWARSKKHPAGILETAGLVAQSEREGGETRFYDRFRGRLMFPICDEQGRVVAFSGRILTDAKDQAKYVNSPETPIFQKGKLLFALDKAKRSILDDKCAVVCEGQLDTITCHEAGLTNVVAPQGTALTEQHARILKRYSDEVVLMFDSDDAGQNAAVRNAEPLWEMGFVIRVALLPAPHDPDSFIKKHGAEKLRELIAGASSFFDFLLARLSRQFDAKTERGKMQIAQQMVEWLCRIRDPILQATFAQRTATRVGVREDAIRQAMRNYRRGQRPASDEGAGEQDVVASRPRGLPDELMVLQLMLADERVVDLVDDRLDRAWLSESVAGETLRQVLKLHGTGRWSGPSGLLGGKQDEEPGRLVAELLMRPLPPGEPTEHATRSVNALERNWLQRQLREIPRQLAQPGLSPTEVVRLQQLVLDLKRKLDNIPALSMPNTKSPSA